MKMDMKVYAHYKEEHGNEFRWRTLLQFGDSWDVIGSVVMKNPGSAKPCVPVSDEKILSALEKFDENGEPSYVWYHFCSDITMEKIALFFCEYYDEEKLNGVVQVFNLFNLRCTDLDDALKRLLPESENYISATTSCLYTTDSDIKNLRIRCPLYIGWGDLWKESKKHAKELTNNARRIFENAKKHPYGKYLAEEMEANEFYHPKYVYLHQSKCNEQIEHEKRRVFQAWRSV